MAGLVARMVDYFSRKEREESARAQEYQALEDEQTALENEARFHEEPSFQSDLARKRGELEVATRELFYEAREPQRSMAQGRCQRLLEDIERPEAVQARLGEVRDRLRSLREETPDAEGIRADRAATG